MKKKVIIAAVVVLLVIIAFIRMRSGNNPGDTSREGIEQIQTREGFPVSLAPVEIGKPPPTTSDPVNLSNLWIWPPSAFE